MVWGVSLEGSLFQLINGERLSGLVLRAAVKGSLPIGSIVVPFFLGGGGGRVSII